MAAEGGVLWLLALGMAACSLTSARLGVHFALKRRSRFIRVVLLCIVIALVIKLAYDQFVQGPRANLIRAAPSEIRSASGQPGSDRRP